MFGADLEIAEAQVSALVREDYITVKKDSGDTDLQWGQKSEEYTGISAYGAFIGSGKENFSPINSTEDHPYSTIEPNQDWNIGFTLKAYCILGFSFSIGFDIDYFLSKMIFE